MGCLQPTHVYLGSEATSHDKLNVSVGAFPPIVFYTKFTYLFFIQAK